MQMDYGSADEWSDTADMADKDIAIPTGLGTAAMAVGSHRARQTQESGKWRTGRAPALNIGKAVLPVQNVFAELSMDDGEADVAPGFTPTLEKCPVPFVINWKQFKYEDSVGK